MNLRISTPVAVAIIVVVVAVAGLLVYRGVTGQHVDTSSDMSPELRSKILRAYGGGAPGPAGGARTPGGPPPSAGR